MKKKRVLFLNPYPENKAPSQRLKYEQYYDSIKNAGWEIKKSSFISEYLWGFIYQPGNFVKKATSISIAYVKRLFTILFVVPRYDVVYVHLWVSPIGPPIFEFLTCLLAKKVIYDIDDLVFLSNSSSANERLKAIKGKRKAIYLMKKANHVITCTPKLDEFVRQYNQHTTDISSTVDTDNRYLPKTSYAIDQLPRIGWSGSVTTLKYLNLLTVPLQKLAQERAFKLVVLGSKDFQMEGVDVEAHDWNAAIEMPILNSFDIGLYPLPDEKWVYGKSGLKAIQYMALGIPTVATAIGANFRVIENNQEGLLVSVENSEEWVSAIKKLLNDDDLRERLGRNGRKKVVSHFSIAVNKAVYLKILNAQLRQM